MCENCSCKKEAGIPRCQTIHMEYQAAFGYLKEVIAEIKRGNPISLEDFVKCMEFVYREGWGDCFQWNGEIPGSKTLKEFLEVLPIERYGR